MIRRWLIAVADACRRALGSLRRLDWFPPRLVELRQENVRRWEIGMLFLRMCVSVMLTSRSFSSCGAWCSRGA